MDYFLYASTGLAALLCTLAGTRNVRAGLLVLVMVILFASMSIQVESRGYTGRTWLYAIQSKRAELYLAASCLLMIVVAVHANLVQIARVPATALIMLLVNMYAGLMDMRENQAEGVMRVGLSVISIGAMAMFSTAVLRTWDDFLPLLRALGLAGILWAGGSLVQAVLDKSQMLVGWQARFVGLLGNPQGTAVYLGPQSAIVLWLVLNDSKRLLRWMWSLLYITLIMFVLWTGSRTGALLAVTGMMFVLRAKLGRAVLLLPIAAIGVVVIGFVVSALEIDLPFARLTEGGDTRTEAWLTLIEDASHAGLFGLGMAGVRFVENSFLMGWVQYGFIMLVILLGLVVAMFVQSLKLWNVRKDVPKHIAQVIDLTLGYYAMLFIGAQFEWHLVSRVDANIPFIVLFGCMGTTILALVRTQQAEMAEREHHGYSSGVEDEAYADYGEDGSGRLA